MDIKNKKDITEINKKTNESQAGLETVDVDNMEADNMEGVKNFLSFSIETIRVFIICLIVIFIIRSFVIQPFFVKGASMQPNFSDGDYLIVDEIGYKIGEPKRGDVIVFRYPKDPSEYFIKRIIGLPGETLDIRDNSITIYNEESPMGITLDEAGYLPESNVTLGSFYIELGEDEYYVLGDNRTASSDSRKWGVLEENLIIGKAWVRAWPFGKFEIFSPTNY